jgi:hypothetical protein
LSMFLLIMLSLLTRETLIGSVRTSLGQRKKKTRWAVSPYPPFHSLRVTAGLVSKKVVKIDVAITALPECTVCI